MSEYNDIRWQQLRLRIFERDKWMCVPCSAKSDTMMHVHHIRYSGHVWEAPDDDLQTLCEGCHTMLGPHPRGGIGYAPGLHVFLYHCPLCAGPLIPDDRIGPYCKCGWDSWRLVSLVQSITVRAPT